MRDCIANVDDIYACTVHVNVDDSHMHTMHLPLFSVIYVFFSKTKFFIKLSLKKNTQKTTAAMI